MAQGWRERVGVRDALVADLYETVLDPGRVAHVIAGFNRFLDCDGVHLIGWDEGKNEVLLSLITGHQIVGAEATYLTHYQAIDPRRKMGARAPTGVCVACHDELDDRYVSGSEFYQDFLIPHGPRYVAGGNVFRDGERHVDIAFNHLVGRSRFDGAKRDALSGVMYHLARWMPMMVRADWLREAAASGQAGMDLLTKGVVFFDDAGRVCHANPAAVQLLGHQLSRVNVGLSGSRDGSSLDARVRAVARTRVAFSTTVHHRSQTLGLRLFPLPRSAQGSSGLGKLADAVGHPSGFHHRAAVVLTVFPLASQRVVDDSGRANLWNLTPAEEALLCALRSGRSPAEYAAMRAVKISTVRSQIRALLEKSGYASLRELLTIRDR